MAKKKQKRGQPLAKLNNPRAIQRRWLQVMRDEIGYLHELSLMLMTERGILPPLYGGEHLEGDSEVIPLWGATADEQEELGILLLRTVDGLEPNRSLREARDEVDIVNDMPVADIFAHLGPPEKPIPVEGGAAIKDLRIAIALFGTQVYAAPGYDRAEMLLAIGEGLPYALFLHIPVSGEDEDLEYEWDDLEHYRAEVVYADTPEGLEMAVWEYRLNLALNDEKIDLLADGADLGEELIAPDVAGLAAVFDVMIMDAVRWYGTTSPVRAKQQALDVLRGEDDDLIVRVPLKPEVEPVPFLAELRPEFEGDADGVVLHLEADSEIMTQVWAQIRPHPYFCIRLRRGEFTLTKSGQPHVSGYLPTPLIEWLTAETLPELYHKVTLHCLRQLLIATGRIRVQVELPDTELLDDTDDVSDLESKS